MKKLLALLLAVVMVVALAACGEAKTEPAPAAERPAPARTEKPAQAKAENMSFITHDSLIPYYEENCIIPV